MKFIIAAIFFCFFIGTLIGIIKNWKNKDDRGEAYIFMFIAFTCLYFAVRVISEEIF